MMKKLGSVIVILISIVAMFFCWNISNTNSSKVNVQATKEATAKRAYNQKQSSIIKALRYHATNSRDPKIRAYSQNQLNMKSISNPIRNFLETDYNWSNESNYKNRNIEVLNYATPNITRIKSIFGSDRGAIQAEGLHSEYLSSRISVINQNRNNIKALVGCNHLSWSTDANQNSNDGVTGQQWFIMNVNLKQNKITQLNKLYENPKVND